LPGPRRGRIVEQSGIDAGLPEKRLCADDDVMAVDVCEHAAAGARDEVAYALGASAFRRTVPGRRILRGKCHNGFRERMFRFCFNGHDETQRPVPIAHEP